MLFPGALNGLAKLGFIAGLGLALTPALAAGAPLSLRETARYAMEHSPKIDTAAKEAYVTTLARRNAGAAFLPTIDLSANLGRRGFSPAAPDNRIDANGNPIFYGQNPWTSGLTLQAEENLFDNFLTIDRYRVAKLKEEQGQLQALETRDQALLEISQSFYQYALDRKSYEIQLDQFDILKKQFTYVSEGYRQGVRTRKDYLRLRTDVNRSEINLRRAKNTLQASRQDLCQLVGVPLDAAPGLDFALDEKEPSLASYAPVALENHRLARIAGFNVESLAIESRIARRRRFPELFANASATYSASDFVQSEVPFGQQDQLIWSAGLTLRFNILDWGVRRREAETAAVQESIQRNARTEQLQGLRATMEKLKLTYDQNVDNYRLSRELLDLETQNIAAITTEYRQGRVQYLDYINALQNLADARTQRFTALYELKKSELSFRYHQGTLYDAIFQN